MRHLYLFSSMILLACIAVGGCKGSASDDTSAKTDSASMQSMMAGDSTASTESVVPSSEASTPSTSAGLGVGRKLMMESFDNVTWSEGEKIDGMETHVGTGGGTTIQLVGAGDTLRSATLSIGGDISDSEQMRSVGETMGYFSGLISQEGSDWMRTTIMDRFGQEITESKTFGTLRANVAFAKTTESSGVFTIGFTAE